MSHSDNCALFFSEIIMLMYYTIPIAMAIKNIIHAVSFFLFFLETKQYNKHTQKYIYMYIDILP